MANHANRVAALVASVAVALGGCATTGDPGDPLEGFNRAMFAVNEGLDKAVVKPTAQAYEAVVPLPGRAGVSNAFANVGDVWIGANNLLQGKPGPAASDIARFLINSTAGIFGLFDVASELGLEKHEEDFGQTLGRWGVGEGAYVVLPFFGPRTLRDSFGLVVDSSVDVVYDVSDVPSRNILIATRLVSDRAQLLPADKLVQEAALDKYSYVRSAYLQRRRSLVHDGNPPRERLDSGAESAPAQSLFDPVDATQRLILVSAQESSLPVQAGPSRN